MKLWLLGLLALSLFSPTNVLGQTKDDTLIYALQSDVQNWDPPNSVLRESIILGYNVFDHLAARDLKTGKVGPSLAVSWKSLDDTTWEVKLRKGVKFHDGTPFGAKDVKASFDRVLNPENKLTVVAITPRSRASRWWTISPSASTPTDPIRSSWSGSPLS